MPPVEPRAPAPPLAMRTLLRRRSSLPQSEWVRGKERRTQPSCTGAATELHVVGWRLSTYEWHR